MTETLDRSAPTGPEISPEAGVPPRPKRILSVYYGGGVTGVDYHRARAAGQGVEVPAADELEAVSVEGPVSNALEPNVVDQSVAPKAVEGEDLQAEMEAEALRDAEARYSDIELLGKSFRVRRNIREAGNQTVRGFARFRAALRNTAARPSEAIKHLAYTRAQKGYERKVERLEDAQSRHKAAGRVVERHKTATREAERNRDAKQTALTEHRERMTGRVTVVNERATRRTTEYIDAKRVATENKLARQAVRGRLREAGASRRDARDILAEVPIAHLERVGKAAITAEASRAIRDRAERLKARAVRDQERNAKRVRSTGEHATRYDDAALEIDKGADTIGSFLLPFTQEQVVLLEEKLEGLTEGAADYKYIAAELEAAKRRVTDYEADLKYARTTAESKRQRAGRSRTGGEAFQAMSATHEAMVGVRSADANLQQRMHDENASRLEDEVGAVVNGKGKRRAS